MNTTCCFTGHRPPRLGGWNPNNPIRNSVKRILKQMILDAMAIGYNTFISGMAQGVDLDAFEIVLSLKPAYPYLKLIAAVPHKGQEISWPMIARQDYQAMLKSADEVHTLAEYYTPNVMQQRNEWMVDQSSHVIAVWDGRDGGTHNTVEYAANQYRSMWIAMPQRPESYMIFYVPTGKRL
jgi:uncharacterized phage-like protein YoqJ